MPMSHSLNLAAHALAEELTLHRDAQAHGGCVGRKARSARADRRAVWNMLRKRAAGCSRMFVHNNHLEP